jgi:hypothetical protein
VAMVAQLTLEATSADGDHFAISLEIGTPYRRESGEWACPVALHGLMDKLSDICGEDSFQALCLAIGLAQSLLQGFRDGGGTLRVEGDDFPLEAYSFAPAIRRRAD